MNDHTNHRLSQIAQALRANGSELFDLAAELDGVVAGEIVLAANQGGTEQAETRSAPTLLGAHIASVVALPVAPVGDETSGASTNCPYGVTWCPDRHGHVCPDCAEFGNDAA